MGVTRRGFIGAAAMAGAGFAAGKPSVSGKPQIAVIGCGRIVATVLLPAFLNEDVVVVATCDCDRSRAEGTRKVVEDYYAQRPERGIKPGACRAETDFRKVIADPSIDAVVIATPDHWHAYITVEALRAGKDVYCEKPLTYSIGEAKVVMAAQRKFGRVLQTGAMQRSDVEFRTAVEIVRNGYLGDIKHVDCHFWAPPHKHVDYANPANAAQEGAPNPDCDFDMWCGPAPLVKYSDKLAPRGMHTFYPSFWRADELFGTGGVGDWGAHHLDIAQWALDMDKSGPVEMIKSEAPPSTEKLREGRRTYGAKIRYATGTVLEHLAEFRKKEGEYNWGCIFYGTKGLVCVNRSKFGLWVGDGVEPSEKVREGLVDGSFDGMKKICFHNRTPRTSLPEFGATFGAAVVKANQYFDLKNAPVKVYKTKGGHRADFVQRMLDRKEPCSPAEVGGRTAIVCGMFNVSYAHDAGFAWDPAANDFASGTGDLAWLTRTAWRRGFEPKI